MKITRPSFKIETSVDGVKILKEIETFARTCYKSEGKITDDSYLEFVRRLLHTRKHAGICDHHCISVRLVVDRGVSHETVRHRIAAYLQESTRYCDYAKADNIEVIDISPHVTLDQYQEWARAMTDAERHYFNLRKMGCKPEIARSVLPNSLKTELIQTMDLTAWRNWFQKRCASNAHPQMREISIPLLTEFKRIIPVVFEDI